MTVLTARAAEYEDGYAWGVVRQLFEAELRAGPHPDDATTLAARVLTKPVASRDEDTYAVLNWWPQAAGRAATPATAATRSHPVSCASPRSPRRAAPTGRSPRPCSSPSERWRTT
jgi:hypothetical protein